MSTAVTRHSSMRAIETNYRKKVGEIAGFEGGVIKVIAEAFGQVVTDLLRLEDEGWEILSKAGFADSVKGMGLDEAKKVTTYLERQTKITGGLLGRGIRLKSNHVLGRGYALKRDDGQDTPTWIENVIQDEDNYATVFSPTALKEMNRILYTSGNLFLMYDTKTKLFERLAIDINIEKALCYPDNAGRIKYILRTINKVDDLAGSAKITREWVPTFAYKQRIKKLKTDLPKELPIKTGKNAEMAKVNQTAVIIEKRVNKDNGETWGIPDSFGAAPWAVMYSSYLKNGAKLQDALATIAYLVKAKSEVAAKAAGAKLSQGRVGMAAIGGPELSIDSVPRSGSVDLYEGRPLQAQCAAALDVSVTGLAADPGLGGSYASESALSQPEQLAALSRQEDFVDLFRQIFLAMGAAQMTIDFKRLDIDPIHRTIQSLNLLREKGGINQEEYRERGAELLDITRTSKALPKPDVWVKGAGQPEVIDVNKGGDSTPGQGVSGDVGSLDDAGNAARDDDSAAGTA